jgi:hypothetical protein
MTHLQMILPKDVEAWLRERAVVGEHASVKDVVAELVAAQRLAELDVEHDDHLWAKPAVDAALGSLERGEGSSLEDGAQFVRVAISAHART